MTTGVKRAAEVDAGVCEPLVKRERGNGGGWEEITVELPAEGPLGIVRLYLPMQEQPAEIDWIELTSKNGSKPTRTAF